MSSIYRCCKKFPKGLQVTHVKKYVENKHGFLRNQASTKLIDKETGKVIATIHGASNTQNATALTIKKAVDLALSYMA